jgi:1-acyl-sn-glycerol-3-phosphate acyltransferase
MPFLPLSLRLLQRDFQPTKATACCRPPHTKQGSASMKDTHKKAIAAQQPQVPAEVENNKYVYTRYFDLEYTRLLVENIIEPMDKAYYRSEFIGFDELPKRNNPDRPLIFISNHSGMAFPWDGMIFAAELFRRHNFSSDCIRPLSAPMLSQTALMNPFMIHRLWKKVGCVDATTLNFETMMQFNDYNILIYPEGVPGIGKGFNRKYQLQRFSTSFVRMALKYKTDIIPFATVNAEYINPYVYSFPAVNRLVNKIGMPFLPMGFITIFALTLPWVFYCGFPAKMTYVMGKRIDPYALLDDPNKPFEDITQAEIERVRDKINAQLQAELDEAVRKYGQSPYRFKEFFKAKHERISKFPALYPFGWPALFYEFDRLYKKGKRNFKMKIKWYDFPLVMLRNPLSIAHLIPILGWIPLLLHAYFTKPKDK